VLAVASGEIVIIRRYHFNLFIINELRDVSLIQKIVANSDPQACSDQIPVGADKLTR
jgi:hypothetical protein